MKPLPVGLFVGRFCPLHSGHCHCLRQMVSECSTVVVGIGSISNSRSAKTPYLFSERESMVRNIFGSKINIVGLHDLGASPESDHWVKYVFRILRDHGLPEPT